MALHAHIHMCKTITEPPTSNILQIFSFFSTFHNISVLQYNFSCFNYAHFRAQTSVHVQYIASKISTSTEALSSLKMSLQYSRLLCISGTTIHSFPTGCFDHLDRPSFDPKLGGVATFSHIRRSRPKPI